MTSADTDSSNISLAATGKLLAGSYPVEPLLGALSSARTITRHADFYNWLQNEICDYLPHEVLLAAWGNFEKGDLSYDVAAVSPGINTRFVSSLPGMDALLSDLYRRTPGNGPDSYVLQDFDDVEADCGIQTKSWLLNFLGVSMKSFLVYRMRDERDNQDCLYVFCSTESRIEIDPLTMDFLMPHIDAALRRVKCLPPETVTRELPQCPVCIGALSERECEVMDWVGMGKSNQEIGSILGISHNTVKNHLKRIFNKMGVTSRSQAVQVHMRSHTLIT